MKLAAVDNDLDREWKTIVQELFDVEKEALENQWMPAPAVYKRAAINLRKQKRYAVEVKMLERFQELTEKHRGGESIYTVAGHMYERLEKARALRDKQI
jgi:hypothetical protein